uniref:Uncharacterized protein n=1 Tax=Noccaea caerulescens TaxID=107243 RepID=A0A1J3GKM0_NOCCA
MFALFLVSHQRPRISLNSLVLLGKPSQSLCGAFIYMYLLDSRVTLVTELQLLKALIEVIMINLAYCSFLCLGDSKGSYYLRGDRSNLHIVFFFFFWRPTSEIDQRWWNLCEEELLEVL